MPDDLTIVGRIKMLLTGKGGKQAEDALDKTTKAAKKTQRAFFGLKGEAADLARQLAGGFGLLQIGRFALNATQKFADWERQLFATRTEARRLGMDLETVVKHAEGLTTTIERQTGILRQDTIQVFNKFLGLTGDVEQATLFLNAAVGAQEGGYKDLTTAANLLGGTLLGEVIEPAKSLGITFDQGKSAAEQQAIVLEEMLQKYLALGGGIDDTRGSLDAMAATSNEVQLSLGEQLAPAIDFVSTAFSNVIKWIQQFGAWAGGVVDQAVVAFTGLGDIIGKAFNIKRLLADPEGYVAEITHSYDRLNRDLVLSQAATADAIADIWDTNAETVTQSAEKQKEAITKALQEASTRGDKERQKRLEKEAADAEKAAQQRIEFERRAEDQILALRIAAAEEGSRERLALEGEALTRAHKMAREQAKAVGADVDLIDQQFQLAREALEDEHRERKAEKDLAAAQTLAESIQAQQQEMLQDEIDAIEEQNEKKLELQLELLEAMRDAELESIEEAGGDVEGAREKWAKRLTRFESKATKERIEQAKIEAQQKMELAHSVASSAVAAATALFGENKAFAIAQAIIDTWGAVNRTLNSLPFPANVAAAAAVAAQGLANVMRIRKAKKEGGGAGFDDPVHDSMAYRGGRRWALDMVNRMDAGWRDGLLAALARYSGGIPAVVPQQLGGDVPDEFRDDAEVHMPPIVFSGPIYGGRAGMRQLSREVAKMLRLDLRRGLR